MADPCGTPITNPHHWDCKPGIVLDCPAVCVYCGATRVFPNASASLTPSNPTVSRTKGALSGSTPSRGSTN